MSKSLENLDHEQLLAYSREQDATINELRFQTDQMKRILYSSKRERFISSKEDECQMTLPFEIPQEEDPEKEQEVVTYVREKNKRKEHPG